MGTKLPIWKKILFAVLAVGLLLGSLELVLALIGVVPMADSVDPFAGFSSRIPHFREVEGEDGSSVVRTAETKKTHFNEAEFRARKAPGTTRVFCLGGSTTYGRPFWAHTSFPGWLGAILPLADDSKTWEVINAGGISYASYRVVGVMRELVAYDPDLFVVYMGHNEFLEYRTHEALINASTIVRDSAALVGQTRIGTVVHRLVAGIEHGASEVPDIRAVDAVGPEAYVRDDELAREIVGHFAGALEELVAIARGAGAEIVFVVPASNLADFSPFKSQHRRGLSTAAAARFLQHRQSASGHLSEGRPDEALVELDRAEALDERHAEVLYAKARVLTELGRHVEAADYFGRARDEDIVPLRAVTAALETVRRVGAQPDVGLVDFDRVAASESENGVPGGALFTDHVHPTINGNRLLAVAVATWILGRSPSPESVKIATSAITGAIDRPRYAAELMKLVEMLDWLVKPELALRCVAEAVEFAPDDVDARFELGSRELRAGRPSAAVPHLERVLELRPESTVALSELGAAYAALGRPGYALDRLQRAVALEPESAELRSQLAVMLVGMDRVADALPHFVEVARLQPNSAQAHSNLALAHAKAGNTKAAEQGYRHAIGLDGQYAPAHYNYGLLLEKMGQRSRAVDAYRLALRASPGHRNARARLTALGGG